MREKDVNYYQSAFNSQREKINKLAEMPKSEKVGARGPVVAHYHYKSSCRS